MFNDSRLTLTYIFIILVLVGFPIPAWAANCNLGSVTLSTQEDVDSFQATYGSDDICTTVQGEILVSGADINNVDGLSDLTYVSELRITNTVLSDIDALSSLSSVQGLYLHNNDALSDIDGLINITKIDGLTITSNDLLTALDGLNGLTGVGFTSSRIEQIEVSENQALTNIGGLSGLTLVNRLILSSNPNLHNIDGLINLTSVEYLVVESNQILSNIDGLAGLTNVGALTIWFCPSLTDINGLTNLTSISNSLQIEVNSNLTNLDGLINLTSVGNNFNISGNDSLVDLDSLSNLVSLNRLELAHNDSLANIDGLSNLTTLSSLQISGNDSLPNIDGLSNLTAISSDLTVSENPVLGNCSSLAPLLGWPDGPPNDTVAGEILIERNDSGCVSVQDIMDSVSGPTAPTINSSNPSTGSVEFSFSPSITPDILWPISGYVAECLSGETSESNNTNQEIPDEGSVVSLINLLGIPYQNAAGLMVSVNITHPRTRHLTLTLISPLGTSVVLWDRAVGDGENLEGTFPIDLEPAESLGAFDGEDFNGDWQLTVADGIATYVGTLNSWGVAFRDKLTATTDASPVNVSGLTNDLIYSCTVSAVTDLGIGPASNIVDVSCMDDSCTTATYTLGAQISGLEGSGLTLQNMGGYDLQVTSNGGLNFETSFVDGSPYDVTVLIQPTNPSQTCVVSNGSGTLDGSNVTDVIVACTTDTFMIGGNVNAFEGSGLVLQNNSGDDLLILDNGAFTFTTPLLDESIYDITVLVQPTNPSQTCSVSYGSGALAGADVTDVIVDCITFCNLNMVFGVVEDGDSQHEACEVLIVGPEFGAAAGSTVSTSAGLVVGLLPQFLIEQGATFEASVCGQSLCETSEEPMPYGCHSCIDQICGEDSFCCDTEFDRVCLDKVNTVCGLICE